MGHLKEKYTREYFLKRDRDNRPTGYGVDGIEYCEKGSMRPQDVSILRNIDFGDASVLDLGFGRGEAIRFAIRAGAKSVTGVDFAESACSIASELLKQSGLKADLCCSDALDFLRKGADSPPGEGYDVVLMLDFVEHVPRGELTEILHLLHRKLSKRSVLLVNTPVFPIDNNVAAEGLDPRAADTSDDWAETSGMHCNRYTRASLRDHLASCGYGALTGHVFAREFDSSRFLRATRLSWLVAWCMGYPVRPRKILHREWFEYVTSPRPAIYRCIFKAAAKILKRAFAFRSTRPGNLPDSPANSGHASPGRLPALGSKDEPGPQWVVVTGGPLSGREMLLDPSSPAEWNREMKEGKYDPFLLEALAKPGDLAGAVFWDVGAHIGYHSLAFAEVVGPTGKVISFEPNPYNVSRLKLNLCRNPDLSARIQLVEAALWSSEGEMDFVLSPDVDSGRSSGSYLKDIDPPGESATYRSFGMARVRATAADRLIADGLPIPSFVKIDIEGAEGEMLAGSQKLLAEHRPVLIIEVHNIASMHDTMTRLLSSGYRTRILKEAPVSPSRCFMLCSPPR